MLPSSYVFWINHVELYNTTVDSAVDSPWRGEAVNFTATELSALNETLVPCLVIMSLWKFHNSDSQVSWPGRRRLLNPYAYKLLHLLREPHVPKAYWSWITSLFMPPLNLAYLFGISWMNMNTNCSLDCVIRGRISKFLAMLRHNVCNNSVGRCPSSVVSLKPRRFGD